MDAPWKEVLLDNRDAIVSSTDSHNVFLSHVLDYLESKRCIQKDHVLLINAEVLPRNRVGKLLDFVSSEGAFNELCSAFRSFKTDGKEQLADTLEKDLRKFLFSVFIYRVRRDKEREREKSHDAVGCLTLMHALW